MEQQDVVSLVTYVCRLTFRDGESICAQLSARSRYDDCIIEYSGAVERLPFAFERADSVLLSACFQSFARELKARFSEELSGEWPNAQTPYDAEQAAPPPNDET